MQTWEPVIDPVVIDENEYAPWDFSVKVFQDKSLPILNSAESRSRKETTKKKETNGSPSSTEEESEEDMVYMQPPKIFHNCHNRGIKTSLSTFLDESDSENEDGAIEKLASAISDLFTGYLSLYLFLKLPYKQFKVSPMYPSGQKQLNIILNY